MTVTRENTEVFDQSHKMWAEGTSDDKPKEEDIETLLSAEGWAISKIDIWYDTMQCFWRWNCSISKPTLTGSELTYTP